MNEFVHLHLHTEYSFLDGLSKVWDLKEKKPSDLINRLVEIKQNSCAITDHGNTAGWVRFEKACNYAKIKPIFGVEGYFCNDRKVKACPEEIKLKLVRGITKVKEKNAIVREYEKKEGYSRRSHFVALALNKKGLYEIQKTTSIASTEGFYHRPRWDWQLIKAMKNCMFGSACAGGIINYHLSMGDPKNENLEKAYDEAKKWKKYLGDRFYIELMALDWEKSKHIEKTSYTIAKDLDIPIVITNDSHYVQEEDWEVHDMLLALRSNRDYKSKDILNDPKRMRYEMHDLYVKDRNQMFSSFKKHHSYITDEEINSMLDKTVEIADRCQNSLMRKSMIMPKLDFIPEITLKGKKNNWNNEVKFVYNLAIEGWKTKIIPYISKDKILEYKERFNYEFKQIVKQGFIPYFILCHDLIEWTDKQGIGRGPARGSSAGSLIAYLLNITMIDPIPYSLLFSRFIDPNRSDYPDIDMDFEDERRHEIVYYFINKYGSKNVSILGNNILFKSKMALKDVARLYNIPLSETQKVCNLIEKGKESSGFADIFNQVDIAKAYKAKYPNVVKFSSKLEGTTKQQGVHAAGIIIGDGDLSKYTSIRRFTKNEDFRISQIDKHDAENLGLLKMDVLGLNTMAIISEAIKLIKANHNIDIDLEEICRDVLYNGGLKEVYKEFAKANTIGVFQFGSPGLTGLSKQIKIDKFQELCDATALHRPGPMGSGAMAEYPKLKFKKREKGLHPIIDKHTKSTYGLIIYQEQVMLIIRELVGFSWEKVNAVRKVISKSGGTEYFMKIFWDDFRKGCKENGLNKKQALAVFNKISSFGSYAFNLSHALSYSMVSYFCMYLKIKFPKEYIVAYLNKVKDSDGTKKKAMIKEIIRLKIPIVDIDVSNSKALFTIEGNKIIIGLSDIKNVGSKAVQTIVENQPYDNLIDFLNKIDNRKCNKGSVESLIKAGAFKNLGYSIKKLLENFEIIHKKFKLKSPKAKAQVLELLNNCKDCEDYSDQKKAELKQSTTPVSIGKHVTTFYRRLYDNFSDHIHYRPLDSIELESGDDNKESCSEIVVVSGILTSIDLKKTIDEDEEIRYSLLNIEDDSGFIVASLSESGCERYEQILNEWVDKVIVIKGSVKTGNKRIYVKEIYLADTLRNYLENEFKPFDVSLNYFFMNPIYRWVNKDKIKDFRVKYKLEPLKNISNLAEGRAKKYFGIVTQLERIKIKKDNQGKNKEFYIIRFEDDSTCVEFPLFPSDPRFKKMKPALRLATRTHEPVMLCLESNKTWATSTTITYAKLPYRTAFEKIFKKVSIKKN